MGRQMGQNAVDFLLHSLEIYGALYLFYIALWREWEKKAKLYWNKFERCVTSVKSSSQFYQPFCVCHKKLSEKYQQRYSKPSFFAYFLSIVSRIREYFTISYTTRQLRKAVLSCFCKSCSENVWWNWHSVFLWVFFSSLSLPFIYSVPITVGHFRFLDTCWEFFFASILVLLLLKITWIFGSTFEIVITNKNWIQVHGFNISK